MIKVNIILVMLVIIANCNRSGAKFRSGKSSVISGPVKAGDSDFKPIGKVLNIAEVEKNGSIQGPVQGVSEEVYGRYVDLECKNSGGVIIDVGNVDEGQYAKLTGQKNSKIPTIKLDKTGKNIKGGSFKYTEPYPILPQRPTYPNSNVVAKVRGQFCPTSNNQKTILFIVDYSSSMGPHDAKSYKGGYRAQPGRDPLRGGNCGRLEAARAILNRIESSSQSDANIRVGMIPFAGGVISNRVVNIMNIEDFRSYVNNVTFCSYSVQDSYPVHPENPGGIATQVKPSTNYEAAFDGASSFLGHLYGSKSVYFISDGEPTSTFSGGSPIEAGERAARELRNRVANLTLNGLLLGPTNNLAKDILKYVTGSENRVRYAEYADSLADEILNFPPASLDLNSFRAELITKPYNSVPLQVVYKERDINNPNIYKYETENFNLVGNIGDVIENVVVVKANGLDGSTYSSTINIRYIR